MLNVCKETESHRISKIEWSSLIAINEEKYDIFKNKIIVINI